MKKSYWYWLLIILILIVVILLGWFFYSRGSTEPPEDFQNNINQLKPGNQVRPQVNINQDGTIIPLVDLPDQDQDGLSDEKEEELGTDPNNPDTDGDGLSDRWEVNILFSDPLNPDTDGDGYLDGEEWLGGYDPTRAGEKLEN